MAQIEIVSDDKQNVWFGGSRGRQHQTQKHDQSNRRLNKVVEFSEFAIAKFTVRHVAPVCQREMNDAVTELGKFGDYGSPCQFSSESSSPA